MGIGGLPHLEFAERLQGLEVEVIFGLSLLRSERNVWKA